MAKRRRFKVATRSRHRRAAPPPGQPAAALPGSVVAELARQTEQIERLGERASSAFADAERRIDEATERAAQADAAAVRVAENRARENAKEQERHAAELARIASERAAAARAAPGTDAPPAERARRRPRKPSLVARLRTELAAWQRRRRQRAMLRRLDRALARRELRIADQSAAALLAVLTERIARLATTTASPAELEDTLAIAKQLSDEYAAYVVRLRAARDASGTSPALRDQATRELARCEAGRFRIDDAIAQLRALGKRSAPPGPPAK